MAMIALFIAATNAAQKAVALDAHVVQATAGAWNVMAITYVITMMDHANLAMIYSREIQRRSRTVKIMWVEGGLSVTRRTTTVVLLISRQILTALSTTTTPTTAATTTGTTVLRTTSSILLLYYVEVLSMPDLM